MLAHAADAIQQAFEDWNNARHWNFAKSTATITLVAPFTVASTTIVDGSTALVSSAGFGSVVVGDVVTGSGIQAETTIITKTDTSNLVMSRAAVTPTSPATVTFNRRDYALPTATAGTTKYIYNIRNPATGAVLHPADARYYDRIFDYPISAGDPQYYDLFPMGELGKIRFLPFPSAAGTIIVKQYRRLGVPSTGADVLDIPQDFEYGILAMAKGYFALDKTNGRELGIDWLAIGAKKLTEAIAADHKQPDEDAGFLPSSFGIQPLQALNRDIRDNEY